MNLPPLEAIQDECRRRSLYRFVRDMWPVAVPGTTFVDGYHVGAVCEHLQAVTEGQILRLLINMPPRHGKSNIAAVMWPMWSWLTNPALRWLYASYALELSTRDSVACRRFAAQPLYQRMLGGLWRPSGDQFAKMRFDNDRGGYRLATSVGGRLTGEGGDAIVIDDPHNAADIGSDIKRKSDLDWFDFSLSTRLNDPKRSTITVIMQRLHEEDMTGHLLEKGGWEHLRLPAEAEAPPCRTTIWFDSREPGELLWPKVYGKPELDALKRNLGVYGSSGQLQQRPAPLEGGMLQARWFPRYKVVGPDDIIELGGNKYRPDAGRRFITVDLAASEKTTADFTVVAVWCQWGDQMALLDMTRAHLEGPDIMPAVHAMVKRWNAGVVGIERVAFQLSMVQQAKRDGLAVVDLVADRDKVSRALMAAPVLEQGRVWLPDHAPWLDDIVREMCMFPNGAHDDTVDAMVYAVILMLQWGWASPSGMGGDERVPADNEYDERDSAAQDDFDALRPAVSPFD